MTTTVRHTRTHYLAFLLLLIYLLKCSKATSVLEITAKFDEIRKNRPAEAQEIAAYDVIKRVLPQKELHEKFQVKISEYLTGNTFQILNSAATNGTVVITGSCATALTRGFCHYLKYFLDAHVSWDGNQLETVKLPYPTANVEVKSPNQFIYYQNVCTHSYSFVWWTWREWREHLDWMAMMGINFFIAPIQEEIWSRVYSKLGMTDEEIDEHIGGPAFLAWQRMGNTRGWGGPLSENFKVYSLELQKRIINAARELGMIVALPVYAGHSPRPFARLFPNASFTDASVWMHFPDELCCPLFLDARDPVFKEVGGIFMEEVIKEYGTDHFYFSDPYNEMLPQSIQLDYINAISNGIYKTMHSVDSEAVWLLQGWMFRNDIWSHDMVKAFVTANAIGTMLILDLQSDQFPIYKEVESYYGQPFIWNMLHNFGGTLGMHGSLDILNSRPMEAQTMRDSTMVGFGVTPEGIFQNYILYEFALEMGWMMKPVNLTEWVTQYLTSRYGQFNTNASLAVDILVNTVYNYKGLNWMHGFYTYNTRPNMWDAPWIWYDIKELKKSWNLFLNSSDALANSTLYRHDLVDLTRQNLQVLTDRYYVELIDSFDNKNLTRFTELSNDFKEILLDLDELLNTECSFTFGTWLESALQFANTIGDGNLTDLYQFNVRNQLTLWGPEGQIIDYANKQWSGLVADFFLPRWELFFDILRYALETGTNVDDSMIHYNMIGHIEQPFVYKLDYSTKCGDGNAVMLAQTIFSKWFNRDNELDLTELYDEPYPRNLKIWS